MRIDSFRVTFHPHWDRCGCTHFLSPPLAPLTLLSLSQFNFNVHLAATHRDEWRRGALLLLLLLLLLLSQRQRARDEDGVEGGKTTDAQQVNRMKALILVGGFGTRLRPLTLSVCASLSLSLSRSCCFGTSSLRACVCVCMYEWL